MNTSFACGWKPRVSALFTSCARMQATNDLQARIARDASSGQLSARVTSAASLLTVPVSGGRIMSVGGVEWTQGTDVDIEWRHLSAQMIPVLH